MYIPKHFREDDLAMLQKLMRDYSFAILVSTQEDSVPVATHLPFTYDTNPAPYGTLRAHMALGNSHWRAFQEERESLVIFQGPHTYISPSWYDVELSVPTWNYATVHAYGKPRIITDHAELYEHLKTLIASHEAQFPKPWPFQLPTDYVEKMMKGIVGFAIEITRLEGKFKMSQNRSLHEQERVIEELSSATDATAREVATAMRERLAKRQIEKAGARESSFKPRSL
jgi:transcriptional regulator